MALIAQIVDPSSIHRTQTKSHTHTHMSECEDFAYAARISMSPSGDAIRAKLLASDLAPLEHLELTDTSDGCGSKFEAIIVSAKFDGVALLERQRLVNEVIAEEMKEIHAFSMKTWTPAQYEAKKAK